MARLQDTGNVPVNIINRIAYYALEFSFAWGVVCPNCIRAVVAVIFIIWRAVSGVILNTQVCSRVREILQITTRPVSFHNAREGKISLPCVPCY